MLEQREQEHPQGDALEAIFAMLQTTNRPNDAFPVVLVRERLYYY